MHEEMSINKIFVSKGFGEIVRRRNILIIYYLIKGSFEKSKKWDSSAIYFGKGYFLLALIQ